MKPCLLRKASVFSTECGNSALLIPASLRPKQLRTDYVSGHMDNMIKHPEVLKELEDGFVRDDGKLSFESAIKLFTYMWNEAVHLGVSPLKIHWKA